MSIRLIATLAAGLVLASCAPREEILPGERRDLRDGMQDEVVTKAAALKLPAPQVNATWTHRAGDTDHAMPHLALGGSTLVWATDIGQGNDRKHRITADPVVSGGLVFTLDSRARVQATNAATGVPVWSADIVPAGEREDDASGGGLAVSGDTLYVTSGFGRLVALNAATGAERWVQDLDAAATGAPTVSSDLVYVVSQDNRAWAVETGNGRIRWQFAGTPSASSMVGGAGPALSDKLAIFPFSSGELVATFRTGGVERWRSRVAGSRLGLAYARVSDITADPVIIGDKVYSGNQSGRVAALSLDSGEVLWSATEGAYSPLWIAGNAIFLMSDQGALVRLNTSDGARVWATQLATFENDKPRRYKDVYAHYGPVLAGGRLWVASDDGLLRAFAPDTGAQISAVALPSGAATNPVVAGQTLYVVTQKGELLAYR